MRARMFVLYLSFRFGPDREAAATARRIVEGDFTEAEYAALEEQAKLLSANED